MNIYIIKEQGYIALISILIVLAIVLSIAISASFFGIIESQMGLSQSLAAQSYYLANACAETALMKLKSNLKYQGNEQISIDNQTCMINLIEGSGNRNRTIKTYSAANNQTKKIVVKIIQVRPDTVIRSWQEVADF